MSAIKAKGTKLYVETSASTFVAIPGLRSVSPSGRAVGIIAASDHDSVAAEKQSDNLIDNGQLAVAGHADVENAVHQFLHDNVGQTVNFRYHVLNAAGVEKTRFAFAAIIREWAMPDAPHDGVYTVAGTLDLTGAITRTTIA